jgi:predicted CoA-binding protein
MKPLPASVAEFLKGKRIAVAGVSHSASQPANAILRKLRGAGYDVIPVNPSASTLEGVACHPDITSIPGTVDGVIVATHPNVSLEIVRQCAERGVKQVWFHRSIGDGSVSGAAVEACKTHGIECIVGGCPLMYCAPVDPFHRCARWWLGLKGRVPV